LLEGPGIPGPSSAHLQSPCLELGHAPYDAIIVSAAFTSVPDALAIQVGNGGRLVQPLGPGVAEEVVLFSKTGGGLKRRHMLTRACFVRLCGRHGFPQ
jgi:protein-L-isoaspartate(D-aspartate) O-methyltransferase